MGTHVAARRRRGRDDPPRIHHYEDHQRDAGEGEDDRPDSPADTTEERSRAMLSDDLQNLRDVDVLTITVPPSLLAVVTGEEQDLAYVGGGRARSRSHQVVSTVDSSSRLDTGKGAYGTTVGALQQCLLVEESPHVTAPSPPILGPIRTSRGHEDIGCNQSCHNALPAAGDGLQGGRRCRGHPSLVAGLWSRS